MKVRKYYAIMQEKVKNLKGEVEIKEYVFPCEGIAPVFARNQAEDYAQEHGYKISLFCPFKN